MMKRLLEPVLCALLVSAGVFCAGCGSGQEVGKSILTFPVAGTTALPAPRTAGGVSLNEALSHRRSARSFTSEGLTREQVSQLLWASQGEPASPPDGANETGATRMAPSAGALYPLEVYLLEGGVLSRYVPGSHSLQVTASGIDPDDLKDAALGQAFVAGAPTVFVIAAEFERTRRKYGARADRYIWMEAGHAAQNLILEATALGLGSLTVGAFDDDAVRSVLGLPPELSPLYIIPVGHSG